MAKHNLTLTCSICGTSEIFSAAKRFEVVILVDRSRWRSEPTADGMSHVSVCPDCSGGAMTHLEAAELCASGVAV